MTCASGVVIADPPWPYQKAGAKHTRASGYVEQGAGAGTQYSTLSLETLAAIPVADLQADYCFLWTVGPFVSAAGPLLQSWGFNPVTMLTWVKRSVKTGKLSFGPGYWFRANAEYVMLGKRKGAPSIRLHVLNVFEAPREGHSKKPDYIHELVEGKFPPGPRFELFARRKRAGWKCLGLELTGRDIADDVRRAARGL